MAYVDRGSCVRASASAQNRDYSYTQREYYCSKCGKIRSSRTDECCGIIKYRMVLIDTFASSAERRRIIKPTEKGKK